MSMSSGLRTSAMLTMEDTEMLPSLTLPSTAMCEWQSTMPGITYWPAASKTWASLGALMEVPTSAILPSLIRTEPCSMVPCETVRMVAFWMRMTEGASGAVAGGVAARDVDGSGSAAKTSAQRMAVRERSLKSANEIFTVHLQKRMNHF